MPGSLKPSWEMQVQAGVLRIGRQAQRQGVVSDADVAVRELLAGQRIYLQARAGLIDEVRARVEAAIKEGGGMTL